MYTSAQISDQGKCKAAYLKPNLTENIEKYMICTNASGNIDSNGKLVQRRTDVSTSDIEYIITFIKTELFVDIFKIMLL